MKSRFVLTPQAKADLREILLEIAYDNFDAAERLRSRMLQGFRTLGKTPSIGHFHDELIDRRYRFWNVVPYVVAYEWKARPIRIIAILHGARDLTVLMGQRVN